MRSEVFLEKQREITDMADMKSKTTITFRPDELMSEQWETALAATGVNDSELARACVEHGFIAAVRKLITSRKQAEREIMKGPKNPFDDAPIFFTTSTV